MVFFLTPYTTDASNIYWSIEPISIKYLLKLTNCGRSYHKNGHAVYHANCEVYVI